MHTGMLWFDGSDKPVLAKIEDAYKHYVKKHGRKPTLILVNPKTIDMQANTTLEVNGATVRSYRPVLPGHIWVGIADDSNAAALRQGPGAEGG